jgi:hypothetical protein
MYYIYHIPSVKIGCTTSPKGRVRQQGYTKYDILETHYDIDIASDREIELQKQYGYPIDKCTYKQSVIKNAHKQHIAGKISATKQWKENRDRELQKSSKGGKANAEKTSKIIQQCDLDWNVLNTFSSTKLAAKHINGHPSTLRGTILSKGTYKGFRWKYPTT